MRANLSPLSLSVVFLLTISGTSVAVHANDKAATCAACHGVDGNSINPEWPNLAGQHSSYIVQQLRLFKDGVRENASMAPMVANLSDEDMQSLGEHFAGLAPKIGAIKAEDIEPGEALYRGGNADSGLPACMACHGPNGAGNAAAKYPALRGQHTRYTTLQLQAYRDDVRQGDEKGIMGTIAKKMTDAEIESVAKYIHALY
ncbi:MAG: c-type cytochrome [Pseudomonadota bacterium]